MTADTFFIGYEDIQTALQWNWESVGIKQRNRLSVDLLETNSKNRLIMDPLESNSKPGLLQWIRWNQTATESTHSFRTHRDLYDYYPCLLAPTSMIR